MSDERGPADGANAPDPAAAGSAPDGSDGPDAPGTSAPGGTPGAAERELRKDNEAGVVTGVCAGLGRYTRLDPVVWRAAFALTGLAGGVGLGLYIAAWALMRDSHGGPAMLEQLLNRRIPGHTVPALLAAGLAVATAFSLMGGFSWGTMVLATPLILGVLVAHNRGLNLREVYRGLPSQLKGQEPPPAAPEPAPKPAYYNPAQPWAQGPSGPIDLSVVAESATATTRDTGDSEDTDGADDGRSARERARDRAERAKERARQAKERRKQRRRPRGPRLVSFVFWAVVAATGIAFGLAGGPSLGTLVGPETGPLYLGSVMVIIGVALVAGAWVGDPRGLVASGLVVSLLLVASASVDLTTMRFGHERWRPTTVADAERPYVLTGGFARLDLRRLDLTAGQRVNVNASVRFGGIEVLVPESARVRVHGTAAVGEIQIDGASRSGTRLDVRRTLEPEPAGGDRGTEGGGETETAQEPPTLLVNLTSYTGDLEVRRDAA